MPLKKPQKLHFPHHTQRSAHTHASLTWHAMHVPGGANGGGYLVTTYQFLGMMVATIFVCALLNSCAVNLVALIDVFSAWWQVPTLTHPQSQPQPRLHSSP